MARVMAQNTHTSAPLPRFYLKLDGQDVFMDMQPFDPQRYGELAGLLADIKQRVREAYPEVVIPPIAVYRMPQPYLDAYPAKQYENNAFTLINRDDEPDFIMVGQYVLDHYTAEEAAGLIAHEFGHAVIDFHQPPAHLPVEQRARECAADHFAAHFAPPAWLIGFLQKQNDARRTLPVPDIFYGEHLSLLAEFVLDQERDHPYSAERIRALRDPAILTLPAMDVPFSGDCHPLPTSRPYEPDRSLQAQRRP